MVTGGREGSVGGGGVLNYRCNTTLYHLRFRKINTHMEAGNARYFFRLDTLKYQNSAGV